MVSVASKGNVNIGNGKAERIDSKGVFMACSLLDK